jgi:transcriptional regulator with XRE-family HTH domain
MSPRRAGARDSRFPQFAERLRRARLETGLRQRECARYCGVSTSVWSNWEHGDRVPSTAAELQAIADVLRADPAWLLGLTDTRRPWPVGTAAPVPPGSPQPSGSTVGSETLPDDAVTLTEAAKVIGVSRQAIHLAVALGRLRAHGEGRSRRVSLREARAAVTGPRRGRKADIDPGGADSSDTHDGEGGPGIDQ